MSTSSEISTIVDTPIPFDGGNNLLANVPTPESKQNLEPKTQWSEVYKNIYEDHNYESLVFI